LESSLDFTNARDFASLCASFNWPCRRPPPTIIGGDGFSYTSYVTFDATSSEIQPAALLWPQAAYQYWNLLQQDTLTSNFGAAFADYNALLNLTGGTAGLVYKDDLYQTLQNNTLSNLSLAVQDEFNLSHLFEHFCNTTNTNVSKLHILRVGSDGSSSDLIVKQWTESDSLVNNGAHSTGQQSGPMARATDLNTLTNADTGSVLSWQLMNNSYCAAAADGVCSSTVNASTEYHFTTTAGTSVASDVVMSPAVPGQFAPITPVLQLADGSFVGSVRGSSGNSMIAFDASGNVNWTVPGYFPQIATADGGIISANGTTFDSNGNATGVLVSLPTQSWVGNQYRLGSVEQEFYFPFRYAASFAALLGGNESGNGTAIDEQERPQLASCTDPKLKPQIPCPGPREIIFNAYFALAAKNTATNAAALLTTNAAQIQSYVFDKLTDPKTGKTAQVADFQTYLLKGFLPYDGTVSTLLQSALGGPSGKHPVRDLFFTDPPGDTELDPNGDAATFPNKTPLTTFFNPYFLDKSAFGANSANMGLLLHEGLHGWIGISDPDLQKALGCTVKTPPQGNSINITVYLPQFLETPPRIAANIVQCN
jgi:hypothetical protein